ncbi:MFS transporter [Orrella sp. 11846]|uniref:MFS transporter n=1 Tax=Orrella sp. 11846 TaxID=3409913 RepID=UPI003B5A9443
MFAAVASFSSLFLSTLVMLLGIGLFNVYVGLKLTQDGVSQVWIGAIISFYYLGLVLGGRLGHTMIVRVGHVRAFAAGAAAVTVTVLLQTLVEDLYAWIVFRFVAGAAMAVQLIVIESWLNEQIENEHRGSIFAIYLVMSGIGTAIGQMAITLYPTLDLRPLTLVAICHVVGLIPIVWTVRLHPAPQLPAPLDIRFFAKKVPSAMATMFLAGAITASFYSLAPVYIVSMSFDTTDVAAFMTVAVIAGLLAQWPMGWLSDRMSRTKLIKTNSAVLLGVTLLLWGWFELPLWVLLVVSAISGVTQFTLYALAMSFANDMVAPERRVSLAAVMLISFGAGACVGPLVAGGVMRAVNSDMLYVFMTTCSLLLLLSVRFLGKNKTHV